MLRLVFHLALRQAEGFAASMLGHGPLHLLIDSTGLKLFDQGEWDEEKHGRTRRSWRKLHPAASAGTEEIVASLLTDNAADDAGQLPVLPEAIEVKSRQ